MAFRALDDRSLFSASSFDGCRCKLSAAAAVLFTLCSHSLITRSSPTRPLLIKPWPSTPHARPIPEHCQRLWPDIKSLHGCEKRGNQESSSFREHFVDAVKWLCQHQYSGEIVALAFYRRSLEEAIHMKPNKGGHA